MNFYFTNINEYIVKFMFYIMSFDTSEHEWLVLHSKVVGVNLVQGKFRTNSERTLFNQFFALLFLTYLISHLSINQKAYLFHSKKLT